MSFDLNFESVSVVTKGDRDSRKKRQPVSCHERAHQLQTRLEAWIFLFNSGNDRDELGNTDF